MLRLLSRPASPGLRALWLATALLVLASPAFAQLPVYTDTLQSGFTDWSWGTRDLAQTAVVHGGAAAISFEPDAWAGVFLHRDAGFTGAEYSAIERWVREDPGQWRWIHHRWKTRPDGSEETYGRCDLRRAFSEEDER